MGMHLRACFALAVALGTANSAGAETRLDTDALQLEVLAGSCANCHGTDGRMVGAVPALAGRSAEQLEARLLAFKHEENTGATIMDRIAKGYTDEELASLADYFSHLPATEELTP
ncbi:MAG: c-type cytochrome [Halomonas sp.]|uniref:c-type cytochrome n=1 Tax=unclassified Halomonas TaxID=2609666 RepID=UPI0009906D30|nr:MULTISPECIES: c-type cytochrome [unclassified Halomonas]AQU81241.1 cytochrome c, class I [Halomonas sp. 'Soap Lake \